MNTTSLPDDLLRLVTASEKFIKDAKELNWGWDDDEECVAVEREFLKVIQAARQSLGLPLAVVPVAALDALEEDLGTSFDDEDLP